MFHEYSTVGNNDNDDIMIYYYFGSQRNADSSITEIDMCMNSCRL